MSESMSEFYVYQRTAEEFPKHYIKVATVTTYDLEGAMIATSDAWDSPATIRWHQQFTRPTSAGDMIVDEAGDAWEVLGLDEFSLMRTVDLCKEALAKEILERIHSTLKKSGYKHPMKGVWLTICEHLAGDEFSVEALEDIANQLGVPQL